MIFDELGDLKPWDAGRLRAHQIAACSSTQVLRRRLKRAQSRRRGWLCWVLARRRAFLDGLIDGLAHELELRARDHPGE